MDRVASTSCDPKPPDGIARASSNGQDVRSRDRLTPHRFHIPHPERQFIGQYQENPIRHNSGRRRHARRLARRMAGMPRRTARLGNRTPHAFGRMTRIERTCLHGWSAVSNTIEYDSGAIDKRAISYPDGYLSTKGRITGTALDQVRAEQRRRDKRALAKVTPLKRRKAS